MTVATTSQVSTPEISSRTTSGVGGESGPASFDRVPGPASPGNPGPGSPGQPGLSAARLSPARLGLLVQQVVAAEQTWRPIVRFTDERRWFRRLALADDYEIWLLSWLPGQHTGFHDHGEARGAFAVAEGELRETLGRPGSGHVQSRRAAAGSVTRFGGAPPARCEQRHLRARAQRARLLAAADGDAPL